MHRQAIGIDIGGSSIKAGIVDLAKGTIIGERRSVPTPAMSAVSEMLHAMADAVPEDSAHLPAGVTFPGVVVGGTVYTAANVAKSWIGQPLSEPAAAKLKRKVVAINDADAAGLAEVHFGAAKGNPGLVLLTTLGTGIGTAIIYRGVLVPNSELGHLEIDGYDAEKRAASSVKEREELPYDEWATKRLQRYYSHVEMLLSPDLFVVGGGVSKDWDKFGPLLDLRTPIIPAKLRNKAGIIGAALAAKDSAEHPDPLHK